MSKITSFLPANKFIPASLIVLSILSGCGRTVDSYYEDAVTLARSGNVAQAVQSLEAAVKLDRPSARLYFGLGVLYAYQGLLDEARTALNKAAETDADYQVTPDPYQVLILEHLNRFSTSVLGGPRVFTEEEITRKTYSPEDIEYIWHRINYKRISSHIIDGCVSDEDKILTLFDWTYRNISFMPAGRQPFPALPMDIMLRGYGMCDRSAWVFISLAKQAGYRGDVFGLRHPETLESPHTVALVFFQDKWVVFDTLNGIIFRQADGTTLAGLGDIINNPSLTHTSTWYKEGGSRCFEKGLIQIPVEAETVLPRMKLVQTALDEFSPNPPKIYSNLHEEISFNIRTFLDYSPADRIALPAKVQGKPYEVTMWFYPFFLRWHYGQGFFKADLMNYAPALAYYQSARQSFLAGNYTEALRQYDALLTPSPDKDYSDDIEYFRCLCHFAAKEYSTAIQALEKYLKDYPDGKWKDGAIYHLARSYEASGLHQRAIGEYAKIAAIPNVQQRMKGCR